MPEEELSMELIIARDIIRKLSGDMYVMTNEHDEIKIILTFKLVKIYANFGGPKDVPEKSNDLIPKQNKQNLASAADVALFSRLDS